MRKKLGKSSKKRIDYYPFGMPMPNRNVEGDYRYGYQGEYAEKDKETGLNAFQLRMYDARIGRWLTPDPKNEFFSPYLAMGNNPTVIIDPTGGITEVGGCPPDCGGEAGAYGGSLDEVVLTGHAPGSSGWSNLLSNLSDIASQTGQHIGVISVGAMNAWSSNTTLTLLPRHDANKYDKSGLGTSFRVGQMVGDFASIITGTEEAIAGGTAAGGGVLATPFTGGASLGVSAVGAAVVVHGGSTAVLGTFNLASGITGLYNSMSSSPHSQNQRRINVNKQNSPVWKKLQNAGNGRKTSGKGKKKKYYEWDHTHNDIEVYNSRGEHLGSMDPTTGEMYKPAVPGRTISL